MSTIQINNDGQITIPPDLRDQLGLVPGTELQIDIVGDTLQVRKKPAGEKGTRLIQAMRGKATSGLSTDNIMHLTRDSE